MKILSKTCVAVGATALLLTLSWGCSSNKSADQPTTQPVSTSSDLQPANVSVSVKRGTSDNGTPTLMQTKIATLQVRVDEIDYSTRGIVLTGPTGEEEIFTVGPEVVNFDQIHKGDLVNAKFTEKLAVSVREATDTATESEIGTISLPAVGDKPGIVATRSGQITATVTAIDHDTRVVSLTGSNGNVVTLQVAPQAQGLDKVQVGDQVVIGYAEAVQISVVGQ
jgi:hypothetical protein